MVETFTAEYLGVFGTVNEIKSEIVFISIVYKNKQTRGLENNIRTLFFSVFLQTLPQINRSFGKVFDTKNFCFSVCFKFYKFSKIYPGNTANVCFGIVHEI